MAIPAKVLLAFLYLLPVPFAVAQYDGSNGGGSGTEAHTEMVIGGVGLLPEQPDWMFGTPPLPQADPYEGIVWKHGDVSWLPKLALLAGWTEDQLPRLEKYILRESGGCPNRRGGDAVDKFCNITKVVEWNHRSDTGLLQINGLNYDTSRNKYALLCKEMGVCTQEPLLDPLTNLRAGKVLYDYWDEHSATGWHPWEPCLWGEIGEDICKKVGGKKKGK